MATGSLYIVSGPIGNLGDITYRAIETLKNVDLILSEDTRETKKLLDKFEITTHQISYRDQNHNKVVSKIISMLNDALDVALVSDGGTPLVSDPGFKLVSELKTRGYKIIPIPGPSSVIASLVASGLPTDKFTFLGFLPKSSAKKEKILKEYGSLDSTLIIFESPYRIGRLLQEVQTTLGDRYVCVAKEITKVYETFFYGKLSKVIEQLEDAKIKGEFVLLIAKKDFLNNE